MSDELRTLLALTLVFAPLSLLSIGGGAALLAEIEHQSVAVHAWTAQREFADLFAISRAAPGPGTMLSTLIGWKVAGFAGALTATVALYLPSSLLVYGAARLWGRWRGSLWHSAVERGLAPIGLRIDTGGRRRRAARIARRARCLGRGGAVGGLDTVPSESPSARALLGWRSGVRLGRRARSVVT